MDKQIADQRNQTWRRLGIIVGAVVLVALAFWIINNFMASNMGTGCGGGPIATD